MQTHLQTEGSIPIPAEQPPAPRYPPSYLDRFLDFVERLPWPYWLTYLVLFILEIFLLHGVAWMEGWLPVFTFSRNLLVFPPWLWVPLAIMTHLDRVSVAALSSFRPLLDLDEQQLNELKYEFSTMPTRGLVLSSLAWAIIYIGLSALTFESFYQDYRVGPILGATIFITGLITFTIGGSIYYHSIRLLRLVNRTVKTVRQFNLFQLNPVYAFSRVTSLAGISWMVMLSLSLLTFPIELAGAPVFAIMILQVLLAIAAFVLPLWFVNNRLVAEKRRLLSELNRHVEITIDGLHRSIAEHMLDEMEKYEKAMAGLSAERAVLAAIPTWPWRGGTLTGFLSALVLPILLFLIQFVIENWLSR